MKDTFTYKELGHLNDLNDKLIIALFYSKDKGHTLLDFIKRAYLVGRNSR